MYVYVSISWKTKIVETDNSTTHELRAKKKTTSTAEAKQKENTKQIMKTTYVQWECVCCGATDLFTSFAMYLCPCSGAMRLTNGGAFNVHTYIDIKSDDDNSIFKIKIKSTDVENVTVFFPSIYFQWIIRNDQKASFGWHHSN